MLRQDVGAAHARPVNRFDARDAGRACAAPTVALVFLLCVFASLRSANAADSSSLLTDFYFRSSNNAVNARDVFQWPMTTDIDAVLMLSADKAATAQVLIVVYNGIDVVAKYKGKQHLTGGMQELRIPKVFATDRSLGDRTLTAKLQLAVKGYAVEQRDYAFEVKGPPQPRAVIESLRIYAPDQSDTPVSKQSSSQFAPGAPFMVEAIINVSDNPAHLHPRLIVLGSMVEDDPYTGYNLPEQTYEGHYDIKTLDMTDGRRRVVARGSLPRSFARPWDNHHPFHIYAIVDFGSGERVVKSVDGDVFDYYPGQDKQQDDISLRLISIARAQTWDESEPNAPKDGAPPHL